jgi:bifunctional DNA-binding transcriptional regulator/antitoxin component of YhaV-PrlF toxin-antitoxin module
VPKEIRERYNIGDRIRMEETPEGLLIRPVEGASIAVKRLTEPDLPPDAKPTGIRKLLAGLRRGKES